MGRRRPAKPSTSPATKRPPPARKLPGALTPPALGLIDAIVERLRGARAVQVLGHARPDGDCIGSLLAVHELLTHWGRPHALAVEEGAAAAHYAELPGYGGILAEPAAALQPDVAVFVDCADRARAFADWPAPALTINLDHHASNTRFAQLNWVEPACAATVELVYYLAWRAGVPLTPPLATALLTGLLTDTGSFRYPAVRPHHLELAAEWLRAGADLPLVARAAYQNQSPGAVALSGQALADLRYAGGGRLVWGELRSPTLTAHGGPEAVPEHLASEMRGIRGVRVAVLFIELPEGGLKVSLRGDGVPDLSLLAREFGGGGHAAAAGLKLAGVPYEATRDRILARAEALLNGPAG